MQLIFSPLTSLINGAIPMKNGTNCNNIQLPYVTELTLCRRLHETHHKPLRDVLAHLVPLMLNTGLTFSQIDLMSPEDTCGETVRTKDNDGETVVIKLTKAARIALEFLKQEPTWWRQSEPDHPKWNGLLSRLEDDIRPSYRQLEDCFNEVLKELDIQDLKFEDLPLLGNTLEQSRHDDYAAVVDRISRMTDLEARLTTEIIKLHTQLRAVHLQNKQQTTKP